MRASPVPDALAPPLGLLEKTAGTSGAARAKSTKFARGTKGYMLRPGGGRLASEIFGKPPVGGSVGANCRGPRLGRIISRWAPPKLAPRRHGPVLPRASALGRRPLFAVRGLTPRARLLRGAAGPTEGQYEGTRPARRLTSPRVPWWGPKGEGGQAQSRIPELHPHVPKPLRLASGSATDGQEGGLVLYRSAGRYSLGTCVLPDSGPGGGQACVSRCPARKPRTKCCVWHRYTGAGGCMQNPDPDTAGFLYRTTPPNLFDECLLKAVFHAVVPPKGSRHKKAKRPCRPERGCRCFPPLPMWC